MQKGLRKEEHYVCSTTVSISSVAVHTPLGRRVEVLVEACMTEICVISSSVLGSKSPISKVLPLGPLMNALIHLFSH